MGTIGGPGIWFFMFIITLIFYIKYSYFLYLEILVKFTLY
jgi:hypothetical protein